MRKLPNSITLRIVKADNGYAIFVGESFANGGTATGLRIATTEWENLTDVLGDVVATEMDTHD